MEKLGALAKEHSVRLFEASEHPAMPHVIGSAPRLRLARFGDWLNELTLAARERGASAMLTRVVEDIAYDDWLLNTCKDKKMAETRMKNVQDLKDWVHKVQLRQDNDFSLEDLVTRLSLMDIIERNETEKESDAVQLMTLHAAKGLEFTHVFMVGVEEGFLPHQNSETDEAIEEERHMAYVGVTRAQRSLTLSFAEKRKKAGEMTTCQPSRFLNELPADDLEWEGQKETAPEEKLARGNANLASLRDLLNNA
jgi:ATP-dependent DNA helicase Rep